MALITLGSAKGAPGVTTTALGMALRWGFPVMLVEADLAGSSVLAGYERGEIPHSKGLVPLAMANMQMPILDALWTQTLEIAPNVHFVAGFAGSAQSGALAGMWGDLGSALRSLESAGIDVIVDLGRLGGRLEEREPLISLSDQHLIVSGSSLPDVYATREFSQRYRAAEASAAEIAGVSLVIVGAGRPYGAQEISKVCGLPVAATIDWDPRAAAVYASGGTRPRGFDRSRLNGSLTALASTVRERVVRRRRLLEGAS